MSDDKVNRQGGTAELFMRLTKTVYVAVMDRAEWWQLEMKYILYVYLLHTVREYISPGGYTTWVYFTVFLLHTLLLIFIFI